MKQFLLLAALCYFVPTTIAQTPEVILQKVQQEYNAEKIYVHYDKSSYLAGETIWFKAYLMNGYLPSVKSTVFGLELVNDSGRVVERRFLPIMGSAAVGDITIPPNMPAGNYNVRAYTRNLMNVGYENFYYHQLRIHNTQKPAPTDVKPITYSIDFFPEGGNLIADVKNIVAFKCTDQFGRPASITGKITDQLGKEQLNFKSEHDGMGKFELTPKQGETYMAEGVVEGTTKKVKALPVAVGGGVTLTVSQQANKKYFNIDASKVVTEDKWPAYILGVQENIVVFKVAAGSKMLKGEIPSGQLLTGILQLTVFNKNHQALAERLVFINSGDYIPDGRLITNKLSLKQRAQNTFTYQLKDTIPGTFSISVISTGVEQNQPDNIVSRFLLSSDIKGRVHNAAYYFEKNDEQRQRHLDLVMLTNGWRRYSWNDMLAGKFPATKKKDPNFISMKAQAFNKSTGKPLVDTDLTVYTKTKDGRTNISMIQTDAEGYLDMAGMTFEDTANFSFRINSGKKQEANVKLLTPGLLQEMHSFNTPLPILIPLDASVQLPVQQAAPSQITRFDGILLDEVRLAAKVRTEGEKFARENVRGRWGSGATKTLDFLTTPPKFNQRIFEYLRNNLAGVNITGGPLDYNINYRNTRSLMGGPMSMTIYLDEFEVDPSMVATLNVSEVAMVKLYPNSAMTGPGGAIAIYTKRGAGISSNNDVPIQEFQIEGFSPTKEFYSPNYTDSANLEVVTDERTTLYWNPYLISSPTNNLITFSFHNSDKARKFKVVLQGMLDDGKLVHIETVYE